MRDSEATKLAILEVSGQLFNIQGYKATSISDITKELGLTKGAIYRHYENKSELEKAALIHLCKSMMVNLGSEIKQAKDVNEKMMAIFDYFIAYTDKSPIKGGCPLMNAAIESDDTNDALKKIVAKIIKNIEGAIINVLKNGIKHGQLKKDIDVKMFAALVFASLEGAIMLSRSLDNPTVLNMVVKNLKTQFNDFLI